MKESSKMLRKVASLYDNVPFLSKLECFHDQ